MGFFKTMALGYKDMGQQATQAIVNNRANIFTGVSVLGTIATSIVSWFGGMKSARKIDAKTAEVGRPLTVKEKAQLCWKETLMPAGTVILSGAGAVTSNRIMAGDIARLTTDVAVVTKAYNEFKKASNEVMTEKQQHEVRQNMAEKEMEKVKEQPKVVNNLVEPSDCGRGQLFMDCFSGIVFFSTVDKVRLAISKLREMMAELKPRIRGDKGVYSPTELGVPYREWLSFVNADTNAVGIYKNDIVLHSHFGWNKGYNDGIEDDDPIEAYFSPGEVMYLGESRSCFMINWEQDPSDMRLGDTLKS